VGVLAPVVTSGPAVAATNSPVVNVASGRCLSVNYGLKFPGLGLSIYDCLGLANQSWTFSAAQELRVYNNTRCLEVSGAVTTSPARAQINTCTGAANQKWQLNASGTITALTSGLCLDVTGSRTANSSRVALATCLGQTNQQWTNTFNGLDGQAPSVPGHPRVSGLTCNSVTFAWNASTDNVGVSFYDVYHDGQLMTSVSGSTLSTTLTVVPGATWGLYVNARDAAGNVSQASTTVPISPPQCSGDSTPPSAPTKLSAAVSGTSVNLTWTASTDNSGVRSYDIYRSGALVGTITGTAFLTPATAFGDSGLSTQTSYTYYVVARDGTGNVSAHSNTASVTTGAACSNPVCAVTQVGADTDIPWGLLTLPDGSILYSRRDAHDIVRLDPTTGAKTTIGTVPNVVSTDGEGGLLGLAIAPTFATDHWLFIMHTSPTDNRIVRIRLDNGLLNNTTEQVLISGILRNKYHNGGRLRFGPDGKLYAATGDAQNGDNAQNLSGLNGKILRLDPDGSVPTDNPFGNYVWSYGHRNPQGLAFDSQGRLWEQEFGNGVMDETNLITKGGNYGWPSCAGTFGAGCATAGFVAPKHTYPTYQGSCSGIAIVRDVLYVACERGQRMYREVISGNTLTGVEEYFTGTYGRLRTIEPAPDGGLWLSTTNVGDKDSVPNNSSEKILHVALGE
jgi:glucose/arabinose dehydrogenase